MLTLVVLFFLYALLFVDAPSDAPGLTWPDSGERHATLGIALQDLKSITEMCGGEPTRDTVNGRPRFMCTRMTHPAFALEAIGEERYLSKATIMQGVGGNSVQIMQQMMNGLELFQIVAGAKVGEFMPDGWFASMAQEDTMVAYDGRIYTTKLLPEMGMIMLSVSPAD